MRAIQKYVEFIKDEVEGAKEYAEMYVEAKAKGNVSTASRYKEMTLDELKHASWIHERAVKEIEKISQTYTPSPEMLEKWELEHKEYVEQAALVRQMLEL